MNLPNIGQMGGGFLANLLRQQNQPQPTMQRPVNPMGQQIPGTQPINPQAQQGGAFAELLNSIRNPPQRNENPSMLRKIGGIITGMGAGVQAQGSVGGQPFGFQGNPALAMQTTDAAINAPYYREMDEHDRKLKRLEGGAKLEIEQGDLDRRFRADEGRLANEERRLTRQEARDSELARQAGTREERERERIEIQRKAQELKQLVASNPNFKTFTGKDGFVYAIDIKNPSAAPIRTEVQTGSLSDMDKLAIGHANSLEEIQARAGATRDNSTHSEALRQTRPTSLTRPPSPNMEARAIVNRASEFARNNPDLAKYIKIDGLTVNVSPTGMVSGPSADQRKKILDALGGSSTATPTKTTPTPVAPAGRIVIYKDGKPAGTVPESQRQLAIDGGYEVR